MTLHKKFLRKSPRISRIALDALSGQTIFLRDFLLRFVIVCKGKINFEGVRSRTRRVFRIFTAVKNPYPEKFDFAAAL
ncbi:hypothetical protein A2943_01700 [Candidatus Adlerbacteria bacterium RIFCSPLOWO2_01_FULL_51_16]|uniref:Uncharacterized protein n=1 Tax=Candidatus Adlerbacteria bacterium RIFCSPLOWO2_01_FULL_51_16 TaxID=1797243 RepID=A0A1F4XEQ4_9BACT|nr:MAG: hypothetical protein A2943_01700 [Candidatus Adlerbacteria bacterium RIFCSPLOWO2_01_FULL_51_16]